MVLRKDKVTQYLKIWRQRVVN